MAFRNFIRRCGWAVNAFRTHEPVIHLGHGVMVDLENRKVIIPGDFHLHSEGDLKLTSDQHLILASGRTPEGRPGYVHGVWINAELDSQGRPLLDSEHEPHEHTEH